LSRVAEDADVFRLSRWQGDEDQSGGRQSGHEVVRQGQWRGSSGVRNPGRSDQIGGLDAANHSSRYIDSSRMVFRNRVHGEALR